MASLLSKSRIRSLIGISLVSLLSVCGPTSTKAQDQTREVVDIPQQEKPPVVKALAPIDETNFAFLNERGQVGVAKFSPGLSLIGWESYSTLQQEVNPSLAIGKNLSAITAGYNEVTQIFDTDGDGRLDFFQALIADWPGRKEGVTITAGPVSDAMGNLYFALSNFSSDPQVAGDAVIMSWDAETKAITPVTLSELPVTGMAISSTGLLAAQLELNSFKDGYYISLTELPGATTNPATSPAAEPELAPVVPAVPEGAGTEPATVAEPDPEPVPAPAENETAETASETAETEDSPPAPVEAPPLPRTLPSFFIPAEITGDQAPSSLCFVEEGDTSRLIVTCPLTKRIIELSPEKSGQLWQGSIVLRESPEKIIDTVCATPGGKILGGGPGGFYPIAGSEDTFRIKALRLGENSIELDFTQPVDRFAGIKPESYNVGVVKLPAGVETKLVITAPVVESDGLTVILPTEGLVENAILRVKCPELPSESGEALLSPNVYYNIHGL